MQTEKIIHKFIGELTNGNAKTTLSLFTADAMINCPNGIITAIQFVEAFFTDNEKAVAKINNIFIDINDSKNCAVYLYLEEHKPNNIIVGFDCAAIFICDTGKISHLTIIFDTYPMHQNFPQLFL
jgi:hypothetical protein